MKPQLQLYSRHACHLCEDMAASLAALMDELGFELEIIDIDADTTLTPLYTSRVPVLQLAETVISEYFLDAEALRQALKEALNNSSMNSQSTK